MKKNFLILFAVTLFSCKKQDDQYLVGNPNGPQLNDIIAFTKISSNILEADSASLTTIQVRINPEADTNNRNVTFTTSSGLFTNNDTTQVVYVNAEGDASVSLLDNKPEMVHIKASVLTYSIDTTVTFTAALPDDILLTSDKYVADTIDSITITTQLFRNAGKGRVSDPVKVFYKVISLDTSVNLVYPAFAFSSTQIANITIINPYKTKGGFNITSQVLSAKGDTLSKNILIKIK